jgi:hypothetical protein
MSEGTFETDVVAGVNRAYVCAPCRPGHRAWVWLLRLIGQARRQYLSRLRPGYVRAMRDKRLGACRGCGSCCDLTFHCPFLSEARRCTNYEKRTLTCRDFPIDALDLRLTRVPCGHYFREEETPQSAAPKDPACARSSN